MTAERLYSALLRVYPTRFREEYGDAMREAFRDMREGARDRAPVVFWRVVLADVICSAARAHLDTHGFAIRWLATCAFGLVSTVAAAHAFAGAFSYVYHPYLEGVRVQPWQYGAGLGVVLGATVGLGQWILLPDEARRARRWASASAILLPIAVLFCGTAIERSLAGVNPVAANSYAEVFAALMYGLIQPQPWTAMAAEFTAMTVCGLVIGLLTSTPLVENRHAY